MASTQKNDPPAPAPAEPAAEPADNQLAALRAENASLQRQVRELEQEVGNRGSVAERETAGLRKAAESTPRTVKGPRGDVSIPDGVFLSEGLRAELEREGRAIDPNTGQRIGDWSAVDG